MRKTLAVLLACSFLLVAGPAKAAEPRGQIIFKDTLYGTLTGALIGGALMLLTDQPTEHFEYVGFGAAVGAISGAVFGAWETTALAELRDGNVYIALPTLRTSRGNDGYVSRVDLFRMGF